MAGGRALTNGAFYAHFSSKDDLVAHVSALLDEFARCPAETQHAYTDGAQAILDEIAVRLAPEDPQSARAQALGLYTMAVGTLQLSRAVSDPELADEVLEQGIRNARVFLG